MADNYLLGYLQCADDLYCRWITYTRLYVPGRAIIVPTTQDVGDDPFNKEHSEAMNQNFRVTMRGGWIIEDKFKEPEPQFCITNLEYIDELNNAANLPWIPIPCTLYTVNVSPNFLEDCILTQENFQEVWREYSIGEIGIRKYIEQRKIIMQKMDSLSNIILSVFNSKNSLTHFIQAMSKPTNKN